MNNLENPQSNQISFETTKAIVGLADNDKELQMVVGGNEHRPSMAQFDAVGFRRSEGDERVSLSLRDDKDGTLPQLRGRINNGDKFSEFIIADRGSETHEAPKPVLITSRKEVDGEVVERQRPASVRSYKALARLTGIHASKLK